MGPDQVELGCVRRGKLATIIEHECPGFQLHVLGDYKHNKGPFSMATRIIIPRIRSLIKLIRKKQFDVVGTAHYQANLAAKYLGIPNFSILDDPRRGVLQFTKFACDEFYLPPFDNKYDQIKKFNALKEWAYLSPKYFTPNKDILEQYDLKERDYLFIREVSTDTSNYLMQEKNLIMKLSDLFAGQFKVVLSLEDKRLKDQYPESWIILKEPVSDIHSLMYYSKIVMSSGDSMAREGAMLGVPSVYLGNRDMPANQILIEKGMLFRKQGGDVASFIKDIFESKVQISGQQEFRENLLLEWDDVTELILSLVNKLSKIKN